MPSSKYDILFEFDHQARYLGESLMNETAYGKQMQEHTDVL
jgi:hypothetical protein